MKKFLIIFFVLLILVLSGVIYFKYYFVVSDAGVKAGELNYIVHKGYIFKTYEGKLIQSGFRSSSKVARNGTAVQSNEFEFSVDDKAIADSLMLNSGKNMVLHYKEYNGTLPWRGYSVFVVDKIISIDKTTTP
jgi:hypothetical protein